MAAVADLTAMKSAVQRTQAAFLKDVREWKEIAKKEKAAHTKAMELDKKADTTTNVEKHRKVVISLSKEAEKWRAGHMRSENSIAMIGNTLEGMIKALEKGHADLKKLAQTLAAQAVDAARIEAAGGEEAEGRARSGGDSAEGPRARR